MSFSHVVVVGRVGKDVEVRATTGGKTVASFSVAVDNGYGDNKQTEWLNIVFFDKTADIAGQWVRKGSLVGVTGRLQTRSWDDKTTGEKKYRTEIIGNQLDLLDKASSGGGEKSSGSRQSAPASRPSAAPVARPTTSDDNGFGDDGF